MAVRYFTAAISPRAGDADAPLRQQAYLRALRTIPHLKIHQGRFLAKEKTRPLASDPTSFVRILVTEEKASDINLETHLLNDAFNKRFEAALVISQDSNLLEPMRIVCKEMGLVLGIGWLEPTLPGKHYRPVSSFIHHATHSKLAHAQFPDPVIRKGGRKMTKPFGW